MTTSTSDRHFFGHLECHMTTSMTAHRHHLECHMTTSMTLEVVNGWPPNATACALLGYAVHHPAVLGPGALLDAKE